MTEQRAAHQVPVVHQGADESTFVVYERPTVADSVWRRRSRHGKKRRLQAARNGRSPYTTQTTDTASDQTAARPDEDARHD